MIGPSNRRAASAGPEHTRAPRSPYHATLANVLEPALHPSASASSLLSMGRSSSEAQAKRVSPAELLQQSASRESLGGAPDRPRTTPGRMRTEARKQRASSAGVQKPSQQASSGTLSGHQEYAMQVMTDFFSRRPLEQMRNAFRDGVPSN